MNAFYDIVTGPVAWFAWGVFLLGSAYRLASMYSLAKKKDSASLGIMSWKFSLRSIFNWLIPFNSLGWRADPLLTITTYVFHICLLLVPVFLSAHIMLWDMSFGFSYPALTDATADLLTLVVLAACAVFAWRRVSNKAVAFITTPQDWLVLVLVALAFGTGFLAYHQIFDYQTMIILHVLAGEAMLIAIPFTRLAHMLFGLFTRAYMGSEFGGIRHARDW